MGDAVVPNGRPHDHEGSPDQVGPLDGLAYNTVDYRVAEDSDATQAIFYAQGSGGYGEEAGDIEQTQSVHGARGYSGDVGYGEEPRIGSNGAAFLTDGSGAVTRELVVARQEDRFGGIKIGSAFFGWLSAIGIAVLLTACVAAGIAAGLLTGWDRNVLSGSAASETVGTTGAIVLLVIVFISFYSGGYVAGRMARFNGVGQGLMVWLWAVLMAGVVTTLSVIVGRGVNVSPAGTVFPGIAFFGGQVSISEVIAVIVAAAVALIAAVLGGTAGMLYHRRVDRVGFSPPEEDQYQT